MGGRALIGAVAIVLVGGCSAARNVKDAADGIRDAAKDSKDLEARVAKSKEITYTATYESKTKDGRTEEVVITQRPPKSSYKQGDSQIIDDGRRVVSCAKSNGKTECVDVGPHTDAGVYGMGGAFSFAFNPASFIGLYTAAAIIPGVDAGRSTRDIGGQSSKCVSIRLSAGSDKGKSFEGCTTDDGVFTFSDDGEGNVVTLTKFEKQASDASFTPPASVRTQQQIVDDATSTTNTTGSSSSTSSSSTGSSSTSTTSPDTTSSTTSIP